MDLKNSCDNMQKKSTTCKFAVEAIKARGLLLGGGVKHQV